MSSSPVINQAHQYVQKLSEITNDNSFHEVRKYSLQRADISCICGNRISHILTERLPKTSPVVVLVLQQLFWFSANTLKFNGRTT